MSKKRTTVTRTIRFLTLALLVQVVLGVFSGAAFAGVTLTPRVDAGGTIQGNEDYVYFGQYPHWAGFIDGVMSNGSIYESEARAILWRVMSVETDGDEAKATLLSHYTIDTNVYGIGKDVTWNSSSMQAFLNTDTDVTRYHRNETLSNEIPGFLHESRFTASEQEAMLSPGPDGGIEKVTLPSSANMSGTWFEEGEGGNDSRKAGYISQDVGFNEPYWTRSLYEAVGAWYVRYDGSLRSGGWNNSYGVRPVFFLNLEAFIFKSGSDVLNSTDAVGSISNPYVLYVATVDVPAAGVDASVNENALTVSFDQPVAHAHIETASAVALAAKFVVANGTTAISVTNAAVTGGKLVLTLGETFAYGADTSNVTVAYKGLDGANDTDSIGLLTDRMVMNSLADGLALTVVNSTPEPTTPTGGGSSSNCNSGVGAAFFALAGLFLVGKRKK